MSTTRRDFIKTISTMTVAGLAGNIACNKNPSDVSIKNVICIIGDDHAANVLGCYGNLKIQTPNLDRMASQGVRFTQAFANAPVCSASRQSILTGKYPHATGVTLLRTSFPEEQVTIAEHLKQAGFKTAVIGKTHFNNNLSHGFDHRITHQHYQEHLKENSPKSIPDHIKTRPPWKPFQDPAQIWLNADSNPSALYDRDTESTFVIQETIKFIEKNQKSRFCLWVGFHEPHSPFHFPIEWAGKYKPEDMPLPDGSSEDDRWIPKIFRDLSDKDKQGIIASYYMSVSYLDYQVGKILDHLKESGLDKETLIIYIGDQGYLLGDHKRFEKHTMWEEAIRSPLIIQAGNRFENGIQTEALTEFVDLAPTILDVLGVPPMAELQGKSLLSLLEGKTNEHKEMVFSEFLCDNKAMVRTREWKYIFTTGKRDLGQGYETGYSPPGITHRLYHLKSDPKETTNVAGDSTNQEILSLLQQKMLNIFIETHPLASQLPAGLTIDQQLVWFCEPPDMNADLNAK
ncbi:sulfatase [bacterium]